MQITSVLAGFSLGQADILRRAMGKKKAKELVKGKLTAGITFQNGKLAGTPTEAGKYPITLQLSANNKNSITKDFELLVKTKNIAPKADTIYAHI